MGPPLTIPSAFRDGQAPGAVRQKRHQVRRQLHQAIQEVLPDKGIIAGGPQGRGCEWLTPGLRPGESSSGLAWEKWLAARVRFHLPEAQAKPARELAEKFLKDWDHQEELTRACIVHAIAHAHLDLKAAYASHSPEELEALSEGEFHQRLMEFYTADAEGAMVGCLNIWM